MSEVAVVKTKRMVAGELARHVRAEAWEQDLLQRLSQRTLLGLARRIVPGFEATQLVEGP